MTRQHTTGLALIAPVAAALVAVGATSGCGADSGGPARTPPATASAASPSAASPADILLAAVPDGSQGGFRFTIKDAATTGSGVVDPAGKAVRLTSVYTDADLGFRMTITFLVKDQESWMKVAFANAENVTGLPKLPKKWMRIDRSKVTGESGTVLSYADPDPAGAASLFEAAAQVRPAGKGAYRGLVDLTRATGNQLVDRETVTALGGKATAVPFRATVDAAGRLTSVRVDVPATDAAKAGAHQVTYRDYGAAPAVTAPPAREVQEAPAAAYELLNG